MNINNCIFCKIVDKEIPAKIIFENNLTLAFLDISPISKGHTVVISKNHYSHLEDIADSVLVEIYLIVKKVATLIHKKLEIDGYNILQNNFIAAGQMINHFHVHVIPRNLNDEKLSIKIPRNPASEEELIHIFNILKL